MIIELNYWGTSLINLQGKVRGKTVIMIFFMITSSRCKAELSRLIEGFQSIDQILPRKIIVRNFFETKN